METGARVALRAPLGSALNVLLLGDDAAVLQQLLHAFLVLRFERRDACGALGLAVIADGRSGLVRTHCETLPVGLDDFRFLFGPRRQSQSEQGGKANGDCGAHDCSPELTSQSPGPEERSESSPLCLPLRACLAIMGTCASRFAVSPLQPRSPSRHSPSRQSPSRRK